MKASVAIRSVALGWSSGSRSSLAAAALSVTARPAHALDPAPASWFVHPIARPLTLLAMTGELIGDKLPKTPSRLSPPGLFARVGAGVLAGFSLADRAHEPGPDTVRAAMVGAAAALGGSYAGYCWRTFAARRLFSGDLPGALIEDAASIALAYLATART
jgi:uncharacterized membrane protein